MDKLNSKSEKQKADVDTQKAKSLILERKISCISNITGQQLKEIENYSKKAVFDKKTVYQ